MTGKKVPWQGLYRKAVEHALELMTLAPESLQEYTYSTVLQSLVDEISWSAAADDD